MAFKNEELIELRPRLLRFCQTRVKPEDAEDLCQDTMTKALASRHLFRGGELIAWLIHMAKNIYRSDLRRNWRALDADAERIAYLMHDRIGHTPPDALPRIELQQTVLALAFLTAGKRETLLATWDNDLNYAEIGELLGIPAGTVKSRIFNARKELENIIDNGSIKNMTFAHALAIKESMAKIVSAAHTSVEPQVMRPVQLG